MAAFILDSLVLCDVAVVDVRAADLRLGTSAAYAQVTGTCNSLRHPLSSWQPANPAKGNEPAGDNPRSGAMPGAGRSRRSSGHPAGSGRPEGGIRFRRIPLGGMPEAAAATIRALPARVVASVGGTLPAYRTPPVSVRGMACR